MPLSGDAKTKYQREYMRRKRAGEAPGKAKGESGGQATAALETRIRELEAENAALKAAANDAQQRQPPPLPRTAADLLARKAQATADRKAKRAEATAARLRTVAAERPDADVPTLLAENDSLKRQLKAAQTRAQNLTQELRHTRQHFEGLAEKTGAMDFATKSALAKCLHPESRNNATDADKDKAFTGLTAWEAANRKARLDAISRSNKV
jgi:hypothetical protein